MVGSSVGFFVCVFRWPFFFSHCLCICPFGCLRSIVFVMRLFDCLVRVCLLQRFVFRWLAPAVGVSVCCSSFQLLYLPPHSLCLFASVCHLFVRLAFAGLVVFVYLFCRFFSFAICLFVCVSLRLLVCSFVCLIAFVGCCFGVFV